MYNHRTMAYYTWRRKRTFMLKFRHIGKNTQNSLTRWFYIYLWSNMDILIFSQQKLYFRYALFKATLRVTMIRTSFGLMLKLFWFNWFLNNTTCLVTIFLAKINPLYIRISEKDLCFGVLIRDIVFRNDIVKVPFAMVSSLCLLSFIVFPFMVLVKHYIHIVYWFFTFFIMIIFIYILFQLVLKSSMWHFYLCLHLFYSVKVKAVWIAMLYLFALD